MSDAVGKTTRWTLPPVKSGPGEYQASDGAITGIGGYDPEWRLGFLAWLDGEPRDETRSPGWLRGWDDGSTHRD